MTTITIESGSERLRQELREEQVLCLRHTPEGSLEGWLMDASSEINMDERMAVVDQESGCVYHRAADGQVRFYAYNAEDDAPLIVLPPLPQDDQAEEVSQAWNPIGQAPQRFSPRQLHQDHAMKLMLEPQQGALPFEDCGELPAPRVHQTEGGLRISLLEFPPVLAPSVPGVTHTPVELADFLELVEGAMIMNNDDLWREEQAWVELVIEADDELHLEYAGGIQRGVLCSCRVHDLTRDLMQRWLTTLKNDVGALCEEREEIQNGQVIAALLFIGGRRGRVLPQLHVVCGTSSSGTPLAAPSGRVLN